MTKRDLLADGEATYSAENAVMQHSLKSQSIDLEQYPVEIVSDTTAQITLGDLHGNAIKLIHFLIRYGVMALSEENYSALIAIYEKDPDSLTSEDIESFNNIITSATVNARTGMIRFIGDELADRGSNDYFTLKIVEKLSKEKIPFVILYSNHGMAFIECFERGLLKKDALGIESVPLVNAEFAPSVLNLKMLLDKELISQEAFEQLVKEHYLSKLKLIDYSFNEKDNILTLYTHAPSDIPMIMRVAHQFKIPIPPDSMTIGAFIDLIDKINSIFFKRIKALTITSLYEEDKKINKDLKKIPFAQLVWNRDSSCLSNATVNVSFQDVRTFFCYGHDSKIVLQNGIRLDNVSGKGTLSGKEESKEWVTEDTGEIPEQWKDYPLTETPELFFKELIPLLKQLPSVKQSAFDDDNNKEALSAAEELKTEMLKVYDPEEKCWKNKSTEKAFNALKTMKTSYSYSSSRGDKLSAIKTCEKTLSENKSFMCKYGVLVCTLLGALTGAVVGAAISFTLLGTDLGLSIGVGAATGAVVAGGLFYAYSRDIGYTREYAQDTFIHSFSKIVSRRK